MTLTEITAEVANRLSRKRYAHSLAVAAQAVKLATLHGENPRRAYTAAVLHDIARELSADRWNDILPESRFDLYRNPPVLLHGFAGERIAAVEFSIDDLEVLEAIRYHTLGFPGMGKTAQIVFVSDYISRDRTFVGEDFRCRIASLSLEEAVLAVIDATADYFMKTGRSLHPDTENEAAFLRRKWK